MEMLTLNTNQIILDIYRSHRNTEWYCNAKSNMQEFKDWLAILR